MTKKRGRQWLRFVKRGLQDVTDMLKNKKFECYLLKNKIPGMVISLIMVAVMLFMAGYFDLKDRIRTNVCRDMSQVEVQKDNSDVDISITVERADYLGYDTYEDLEKQGRYYYVQQDGKFAIMLLNSNEDVLLNHTVRGRILPADSTYDKIVEGLAADIGISTQQLRSSMYDFVISEIDFPKAYYNMMLMVLALVCLWCIYVIIWSLHTVCCPWKTAHVRETLGKQVDRMVIRDIDEQLRYHMYYDQDKIAITDKYFVYHGMWHTDVVALRNIEAFKKLRTSSNIGVGNKRIYKLLMVDVDGVTYEQNFKTEDALDEALSYLRDR